MDPNECLREIREFVSIIEKRDKEGDFELIGLSAVELADKVAALDNWIKRGGFLPADWQNDNLDQK
jgi:hypothetical protein